MTEKLKSIFDNDAIKIFARLMAMVALPWSYWVSTHVIDFMAFQQRGDRFTRNDAHMMMERLDARIDSLPPPDWRDRIRTAEMDIRSIHVEMRRVENEFTSEFVRKDELQLPAQ